MESSGGAEAVPAIRAQSRGRQFPADVADRFWGAFSMISSGASSSSTTACTAGRETEFSKVFGFCGPDIVEFLGGTSLSSSFLSVCRWWFNAAVCHPGAFRIPVEAWRVSACRELDAQLSRMREPPSGDEAEDLRIGLEHAEEELRLTELSASFPSGVTVVLLRFAQRLSGLLHWINIGPCSAQARAQDGASTMKRAYVQREAEEFKRRVALLSGAVGELRKRLPDPELPIRWAKWFEEVGEIAGFPADHCARYRSQREQVAAVWANNRRTFLSTDEHVDALLQSLRELDECLSDTNDAGSRPANLTDSQKPILRDKWPDGRCGIGLRQLAALLRRCHICRQLFPSAWPQRQSCMSPHEADTCTK